MARRLMLLLALVFSGVAATQARAPTLAPTLTEVLSQYYEAIGGVGAWQQVQTVRMTGRLSVPGGSEAPFSLTFARPFKSRFEYTVDGKTAVQGYDGTVGWVTMPLPDIDGPIEMTETETRLMRELAEFEGALVGWKEKGSTVALVEGGEDADYRVRVTPASGAERDYILDRQTFFPLAMEMTASFGDEEYVVETLYGDYREVGGLILAHVVESRPQGAPAGQRMMLDSVELDIEVDDELFTMPAASERHDADGQP